MLVVETDRLLLRQFELADSAPLMAVFGDAEVMRHGDGIKTVEWVQSWLRDVQASYRKGYGTWAVVEKRSSSVLGYCGLEYADVCGQAEVALGYRLARAHWGRGYASEAVAATVHYGLNVLELTRLVATIDPGNSASVRVAEKAGMVYEKDVLYEGYTHPDRVYAVERETPSRPVTSVEKR